MYLPYFWFLSFELSRTKDPRFQYLDNAFCLIINKLLHMLTYPIYRISNNPFGKKVTMDWQAEQCSARVAHNKIRNAMANFR